MLTQATNKSTPGVTAVKASPRLHVVPPLPFMGQEMQIQPICQSHAADLYEGMKVHNVCDLGHTIVHTGEHRQLGLITLVMTDTDRCAVMGRCSVIGFLVEGAPIVGCTA